ncbi:hypothetical protein K8D10_22730 [Aeromonas veronii]|uniref:hypothetical protein n=1 Tax=Aeromonas veronii TaxID=654 RepID=UPI00207C9C45|nr:hypothetical protein [Aeromonas veronii]MCO4174559.1 hypothetical protein [Aeromonas veronii]
MFTVKNNGCLSDVTTLLAVRADEKGKVSKGDLLSAIKTIKNIPQHSLSLSDYSKALYDIEGLSAVLKKQKSKMFARKDAMLSGILHFAEMNCLEDAAVPVKSHAHHAPSTPAALRAQAGNKEWGQRLADAGLQPEDRRELLTARNSDGQARYSYDNLTGSSGLEVDVDEFNLSQMVKGNPGSYNDDNDLMFKRLSSIKVDGREHNSPNEISTVSGTVGASESDRQSQLNVPNSKNELIFNIIERLVGIVETGRGGMRTLQGEQFNETMTKLAALYIDLQPEGALSGGKDIMHKSKGFRRPPKDLVNQKSERGNLYDFMTPYLTRDLDSEDFCLQNVTSDLHKWTKYIIDKQQKRLPTGKSAELLMRMNNAADPEITRAEFTKKPTSRPPEDQEEAIQFIYYMAGQFESESEWNDFARGMYVDEYPQLKNVTYERAKRIFHKNNSLSIYKS